jgi:hypothetical protein
LEKTTKQVLDSVLEQNVNFSVKKINSLHLNDACDTNVVAGIIFERAMENPELIAKLCFDLNPCLFDTIIRQSGVELDLDRGFDALRVTLTSELKHAEGVSETFVRSRRQLCLFRKCCAPF